VLFDMLFDAEMMAARAGPVGGARRQPRGLPKLVSAALITTGEERERTVSPHQHAELEQDPELHAALVAKFRNGADFPIIKASNSLARARHAGSHRADGGTDLSVLARTRRADFPHPAFRLRHQTRGGRR
jgi:hypothetical protein